MSFASKKINKKATVAQPAWQCYRKLNQFVCALWENKEDAGLWFAESKDNGRSWIHKQRLCDWNPKGEVNIDLDVEGNIYIFLFDYPTSIATKAKDATEFKMTLVEQTSLIPA